MATRPKRYSSSAAQQVAPPEPIVAYERLPVIGSWSNPGWQPVAVLLAVLVAVTFANSLHGELVLDNSVIIGEDIRLRAFNAQTLEQIFKENYWWPSLASDLYRPLTTLSYLLNAEFNRAILGPDYGKHVVSYHVVNLILHWLNSVLMFCLVRRVLGNAWQAVFAATLFAVHPLVVESVSNIVGRADLLVTLCVLTALVLHMRALTVSGLERLLAIWGMGVASLIGVFCKENAIVIVAMLPVYDFSIARGATIFQRLRSFWRQFAWFGWAHYLAIVPAVLALFAARHVVLGETPVFDQVGVDNPIATADFFTGKMTAFKVVGYYLWLFVFPRTLSCDYSHSEITLYGWGFSTAQDWHTYIGLLLMLGITLMTIVAALRQWKSFFFLSFFIVAFLPTSNLLITIGTIMAERIMYLPLVGLVGVAAVVAPKLVGWMLTPLIHGLPERMPMQRALMSLMAVTLIMVLGARSFVRNYDWSDEVSLWKSAVEAAPNSFKVHKGLALALAKVNYDGQPAGATIPNGGKQQPVDDPAQQDDPQQTADEQPDELVEATPLPPHLSAKVPLEEIIAIAERGLQILDDSPMDLTHLPGQLFLDLGHYYAFMGERAIHEAGLQDATDSPEAMQWFRKSEAILLRAREIDRAVNAASRKSRLARGMPDSRIQAVGNPNVYNDLGITYRRMAEYTKAIEAYQYQTNLDPLNRVPYFNLGVCYYQIGQYENAARSFLKALMVTPGDDPYIECWQNLILVYEKISPEPKAIIPNPNGGPAINDSNPVVRRHIDEANYQFVEHLVRTKHFRDALAMRNRAVLQFNCPAQIFSKFDAELKKYEAPERSLLGFP